MSEGDRILRESTALFVSEERLIEAGDTFKVEFEMPRGAEPTRLRWVLVQQRGDEPQPGDTQEIDTTSFGATERTILVQRYMEGGWVTVATRSEPFEEALD